MVVTMTLNANSRIGGSRNQPQGINPAVLPIQLISSQVRPVAYRILSKKHGLNLKSTGLDVLTEFLGHNFGIDWRGARAEKFLDEISRRWKDQDRGLFIEGPALSEIIRDIVDYERSGSPGVLNGNAQTLITSSSSSSSLSSTALVLNEYNNEEYTAAIPVGSTETFIDLPSRRDSAGNMASWQNYLKVVNAQSQPFYHYVPLKKNFDISETKPSILASAKDQVSLFLTRYHLIYSRILRNESFQTPSFRANVTNNSSMAGSKYYSITMIKNMLGRNNAQFLIFGYVSKGADGEWWLQDMSGKIQLDISQAIAAGGSYYTPGNFVLCDGIHFNERFIVGTMGPPPAERRETTKVAYGNIDFLGVHSANGIGGATHRVERIDKTLEKHLILEERQHVHHRIIVLGMNIFLDQLRVIDALRKLFTRLQQEVEALERPLYPVAIIFPGSFKSTPFQADGNSTQYKESFDFLAQLFRDFPSIANSCKFVFVPGDNDAWASTFSSGATPLWPLQPIPHLFTNRVKRASPEASFGSNPCRMTYLSQEIVIVRDDYGARLRRQSILFPNAELTDAEIALEEITINGDNDTVANKNPTDEMEIDAILLNDNGNDDDDTGSDNEGLSQRRALDKILNDSNKVIKNSGKPFIPPDIAEARKVVKTLLDQGHLSPFPLALRPVSWNYDHSLSLAPLPSMLVLADISTPPFRATYEGCHVINPGPFLQGNQICWTEYNPSKGTSEQKFLYL